MDKFKFFKDKVGYGLGAVNGVMEWMRQRKRGYNPSGDIFVPIIPAACIFDLMVNGCYYPTIDDAYQACENATPDNLEHGQIGAGCGATVGKWHDSQLCGQGGLGCATLQHESGLIVRCYAVVNSVGDVVDMQQKQVVAKQYKTDLDERYKLNTTLIAVFTNAKLTRHQLLAVSRMATSGIARTINPAFTPYDGDIAFAISLGEVDASSFLTGQLAAEATQQAIVNAIGVC